MRADARDSLFIEGKPFQVKADALCHAERCDRAP